MKLAAIYVRVSTADQHVESQLYDLRELAAQRGLEVVQEYRDSGISGKRARRPGLDALIAEGAKRVPANVRFVLTSLAAVGHTITHACWWPINKLEFEGDRQGFLLALSAVVLSNEIVRFSAP